MIEKVVEEEVVDEGGGLIESHIESHNQESGGHTEIWRDDSRFYVHCYSYWCYSLIEHWIR